MSGTDDVVAKDPAAVEEDPASVEEDPASVEEDRASVAPPESDARAGAGPRRHATVVYTALRLLLLLVTLGVVWLLGARGWLWLLLGFLVSGLLSLVLLSRQRDAMSAGVAGFFGRINARIEASKRAEDEDWDEDTADAPTDRTGDDGPGTQPARDAG